jgi:hypothetical protein
VIFPQPTHPIEPHVVTLGVDFADGRLPVRVIYEIFRGDPGECKHLMGRVTCPSHDKRPIEHWWLQSGLASAWEDFVRSI